MSTIFSRQTFCFESVTLNRQGEVTARQPGEAQVVTDHLENGVTLNLVEIHGGMCQIGTLGGGYADEMPRHLVSIASFLLGQSLITQAQWQTVMGKGHRGRFSGPDLPVENVSWLEAQEFCRRLSKKTGHPYTLASEAQWEYACRAQKQTPFSTGETITTDYANYVGEHTYREEPRGSYRHLPTPAGTFLPNPFGVYDMHGNLWEFCADRWHEDYSGAPIDGSAWDWNGEAGYRVARGGSWHEPPVNCRSATRLRVNEHEPEDYCGFRVMMHWQGN